MKSLYSHYDKTKINELPRVNFPGRIVVVNGEAEAERAVDYLMRQDIIGLDTETKPNFKKGGMNAVALLQISSREVCFLFRALSWTDDIHQLHRRRDFLPGRFFELQRYVQAIGIEDLSLQKLYANVFGEKISKTQQLSNWEAPSLTQAQKLYAATDAWACIRLYEELKRLQHEGFEIISEEG